MIISPGRFIEAGEEEPIMQACASRGDRFGDIAAMTMPPSAITGTPGRGGDAHRVDDRAYLWHTDSADDARRTKSQPGPMPTFTPSTPASIRSFAPSAVAMFPAMTWIFQLRLISRTVSRTLLL